jgi:hypothetical protein
MKFHMLLAASLAGAAMACVQPANATAIVTIEQVGGNVVATEAGSFDITDLGFEGIANVPAGIESINAGLFIGEGSSLDVYGSISGPSRFGSGGAFFATSASGDSFAFEAPGQLGVPSGYVSGTEISGSATWDDTTLSALGITPGTYTYTWGAGPDADSFTLYAGVEPPAVPEPSTITLFGAGLLGAALLAFRKTRGSSAGNPVGVPGSSL